MHRSARVHAFQALFEAEFGRRSALEALRDEAGGELLGAAEGAYAAALVQGVTECRQTLDQIIGETAPAWPVEQLSAVDRTLLRIALYELLFNNAAVPPGAVINEAVELAKRFGSDASRRFVNGVLGTVSRKRLAPAAGELSKREGVREPD